jgi:AcrR family transcriptional regulator
MAKRSIDRRVGRTTKTLYHALISLILKKNYEATTIQEICDAANVGRSTFYAHYTSKQQFGDAWRGARPVRLRRAGEPLKAQRLLGTPTGRRGVKVSPGRGRGWGWSCRAKEPLGAFCLVGA